MASVFLMQFWHFTSSSAFSRYPLMYIIYHLNLLAHTSCFSWSSWFRPKPVMDSVCKYKMEHSHSIYHQKKVRMKNPISGWSTEALGTLFPYLYMQGLSNSHIDTAREHKQQLKPQITGDNLRVAARGVTLKPWSVLNIEQAEEQADFQVNRWKHCRVAKAELDIKKTVSSY